MIFFCAAFSFFPATRVDLIALFCALFCAPVFSLYPFHTSRTVSHPLVLETCSCKSISLSLCPSSRHSVISRGLLLWIVTVRNRLSFIKMRTDSSGSEVSSTHPFIWIQLKLGRFTKKAKCRRTTLHEWGVFYLGAMWLYLKEITVMVEEPDSAGVSGVGCSHSYLCSELVSSPESPLCPTFL